MPPHHPLRKLGEVLSDTVFLKLVAEEYQGGPYSLEEVLQVFTQYFAAYKKWRGVDHPRICRKQIQHIIEAMPFLNAEGGCDIDSGCYEALIDAHFRTKYRRCDYNINHFFSGRIRELRYFEELY